MLWQQDRRASTLPLHKEKSADVRHVLTFHPSLDDTELVILTNDLIGNAPQYAEPHTYSSGTLYFD